MSSPRMLLAALLFLPASLVSAQQSPSDGPYKLLKTERVGGAGGFDYVLADSAGRRLYIPRSGGRGAAARVTVFDLDTLKSVGEVPEAMGVHGTAVDPKSAHGFSSSNPVLMFDTKTLKTIKSKGRPTAFCSTRLPAMFLC